MANVARDLVRGSFDLHIHAAPDAVPRLLTDLKLAEAAREVGMGGIILKSHHMMTADRAVIAQSLYPDIKIFGGLALNVPATGGLNSEAVKAAIRLGAKIIWLPTLSAANYIQFMASKGPSKIAEGFAPRVAPVLDENGAVLPELKEILAQIAQADIILALGHLSVAEIKVVVDAAIAVGVKKIMVNHPELRAISMSIEDQIELAAKGVMLERCVGTMKHGYTPKYFADEIRAVGVASTVMATDYGQPNSPPAPTGMLEYVELMLAEGIPASDIEIMTKVNPSKLLGLQ